MLRNIKYARLSKVLKSGINRQLHSRYGSNETTKIIYKSASLPYVNLLEGMEIRSIMK